MFEVVFRAEGKLNIFCDVGIAKALGSPKECLQNGKVLIYTCPGKKRLNSSAQLQMRKNDINPDS